MLILIIRSFFSPFLAANDGILEVTHIARDDLLSNQSIPTLFEPIQGLFVLAPFLDFLTILHCSIDLIAYAVRHLKLVQLGGIDHLIQLGEADT